MQNFVYLTIDNVNQDALEDRRGRLGFDTPLYKISRCM